MIGRHLAEITRDELRLLRAAVNSIGVNEVVGEALHLRTLADGRMWLVESAAGQLVVDVVDDSYDSDREEMEVAISERVCRFAECFANDTLTISIADEHTIIATAGSTTAAIDVVARTGPTPRAAHIVPAASVAVPMRQFQMLLWSARSLPSGVAETTYPMPPMWLQFRDDWLGLHVDWSDFVPSRSTYRIATIMGVGHASTSIPHQLIHSFLQCVPTTDDDDEPELMITVGTTRDHGITRQAIMFEADSWRLLFWLTDELETRWAAAVNEQLAAAGVDVLDTDNIEWTVKSNGFEVRIKLHHSHPDVARVSAVLVGSAEESIELLRELGELNSSSTGVRYWLDADVVRAAVDVQCTALTTIAEVVEVVGKAASDYSAMLTALGGAA